MTNQPLTIAVDFDGTIVEHKYPQIGREMMFAFETLKALQEKGHRLILWTYRAGKELDEAVAYCKENGVEFFAVNKSYPEEELDLSSESRKIEADLFIDDRNFGGFPGWGRIFQMIYPNGPHAEHNYKPIFEEEHYNSIARKTGFLKRLFK